MQATVLQVGTGQLLAGCFAVGNQVFITYNGVMTASIPPQISAMSICLIRS